jgi:hypothetical protein
MSDTDRVDGLRKALDAYRSDPGGAVRLDTGAITTAGRRRLRRRTVARAAGVGAVAVLVGVVIAVPQLRGGAPRHREGPLVVGSAVGSDLPSTGRDVAVLFSETLGVHDGHIRSGGPGRADSDRFLRLLGGERPRYRDTGWEAGHDTPKPRVGWALLTWVEGDRAAEGLLGVDGEPAYFAMDPPAYRSCQPNPRLTCEVRKIAGKGWLKVVRRNGGSSTLEIALQRDDGACITFTMGQGAVTKVPLAGGRSPLGHWPVSEAAAIDAVLRLR